MFGQDEESQLKGLLRQAELVSRSGVDFLQIREKDLPCDRLIAISREIAAVVRRNGATRILLNGSLEQARAAGADGVHLTSTALDGFVNQDPSAKLAGLLVSASCHDLKRISLAKSIATLILFGPVFEKRVQGELVQAGAGLFALAAACRLASPIPVLALGGVDSSTLNACLEQGAAGIAGIRHFCPANYA